jgi:hypothetical protein
VEEGQIEPEISFYGYGVYLGVDNLVVKRPVSGGYLNFEIPTGCGVQILSESRKTACCEFFF